MKKYTTETFIGKARELHGDKYDYSKVEYINSQTKVCIICPIHGEFWQTPNSHLNGNGCPSCSGLKKRTTETFIAKAREVHGDKYDYSKTQYINKRSKVIITCPEHGDFEQCANNHLRGQGCPKCGELIAQNRIGNYTNARLTNEIFRERVNEIYKNEYDVCGEYVNNKTYLDFYCHHIGGNGKEHGIFSARPDWILRGHGCPKCGCVKSKGETEIIDFIRQYYSGEIIERDREILNGKELDIYIPEFKLGIEYNGLIWHSEKYREPHHMLNKLEICESKGIKVINIFEDEWVTKRNICESRIRNAIGNSETIYARKCEIREVNNKKAKEFIDENHLQGGIYCKYNLGLYYQGDLVSIMTFGNLRKNLGSKSSEGSYELLRFCNKLGYNVVGGASKLMKYFIKMYSPKMIISYADKRWSNGNLYEKIGFNFEKDTTPNYFYITYSGQHRINRYALRKDVLVNKYNCPKEMSEHEFCLQNGFYRVYDCGHKKYIWKNQN